MDHPMFQVITKPPEWDLRPNGPRLHSNPDLRWDLANQRWGNPTKESKRGGRDGG